MDITHYVDELNQQLLIAAEAGGDDARQLAERLVAPLQAATRLILLDALSAAAGEITSELAPGSVEVRLRGRDPEFVVTSPPVDVLDDTSPGPPPAAASGPTPAPAEGDDSGTSRVTLRLPEPLKQRIEDAAARDGVSVNSWLVRTLAGVVEPTGRAATSTHRRSSGGDRFTGWATS